MKFATTRLYSDPEAAARKLIEIANSVEAAQDGPNPHRTKETWQLAPVRSQRWRDCQPSAPAL
jgi:hypothetical protein